jgi:osmotically-inducible protein OsmY
MPAAPGRGTLREPAGQTDTLLARAGRASGERKESQMSDADLELDVNDELLWDPRVDPAAIAVSAKDGAVTLRGTVGSFRERRDAKRAAKRVYGVTSVDDQMEVRILTQDRRDDADLRGFVLQMLMLDSLVPSTIDAQVKDGVVKLTGTAEWQYQRDAAENDVVNLVGVVDLVDDVALVGPGPSASDVKGSIKKAFKRNAKLDSEDLDVKTSNGTITLTGVVSSWAEHDEAVDAAWAAPGVAKVDDRILVEY